MAIKLDNSAQVSAFINKTVAAAQAIFDLQGLLQEYSIVASVNDASTQLGANGATFQAAFTLTPAEVNAALFTALMISNTLDAQLTTGAVLNLNKVRSSLGVIVGTG
jgi:hypothetical protein